jgi:glycosyltransferase involved in cell wall biosynthesis
MIITVKPLFDENYLRRFYSGQRSIFLVIKGYIKRFGVLFTLYRYNRIVVEKELFPYFPAFFEWLLFKLGINYIVDYDDAIFHNYDRSSNWIVRTVLGKKIDRVMKYGHIVIAGNKYLAERARVAGATTVYILPTVVDLSRYKTKDHVSQTPLVIGWIGTKSTFNKHFLIIRDIVETALKNLQIEIHIVGISCDTGLGEKVKCFDWSEENEVSSILNFDIGIMPLQDSPWEQGKCAYKLIQYMACGLPVIASPVGMNNEVVLPGKNGYLATSESEWISAMKLYIHDKELRVAHGDVGHQLVKNRYSLDSSIRTLVEILKR